MSNILLIPLNQSTCGTLDLFNPTYVAHSEVRETVLWERWSHLQLDRKSSLVSLIPMYEKHTGFALR